MNIDETCKIAGWVSALHLSAQNGHNESSRVLLYAGCNTDRVIFQAGFSALHLSAQNGHNESSRVLLYAGCNTDHKNNVSTVKPLKFRTPEYLE